MSRERVRWLIKRQQKGHSLFYWYPPKDVRNEAARLSPLSPKHKALATCLVIRSLGKDYATAVAEAIRLNDRVDALRRGEFSASNATVAALIDAFRNSSEWTDLSPGTQGFYGEYFAFLVPLIGDLEASTITRESVREIVEDCRSDGKHRKGEGVVQTMRRLWSFAIDDATWSRRIKAQIFGQFFKRQTRKKSMARKVGSRRAWTPDEARTFFASAQACQRQSVGLATALALYTSMDPKDIRELDATDLVAPVFDFASKREVAPIGIMSRRGKSDVPVVYPILNPWLASELIQARKRGGFVILDEHKNAPYRSRFDFAAAVREVREAGGLPSSLKFRHLRHTRLRQAQAAGVSAKGLQALAGHAHPSTIEHYTGFDVGLALDAIEAAERIHPVEWLRHDGKERPNEAGSRED